MDEKKGINNALGTIRIADEVVSIIAGLAATEVEGVAGMSGGIAGGIAEILGRYRQACLRACDGRGHCGDGNSGRASEREPKQIRI